MADQQDDLVTIHLDEPRQYRDRETWVVTELPKGNVKVPRSVAKRWGITPVGAHKADDDKPAVATAAKA